MNEKTVSIEYRVIRVDTDNSNKPMKLELMYYALDTSFLTEEEAWKAIEEHGDYGDAFTVVKVMKVRK